MQTLGFQHVGYSSLIRVEPGPRVLGVWSLSYCTIMGKCFSMHPDTVEDTEGEDTIAVSLAQSEGSLTDWLF